MGLAIAVAGWFRPTTSVFLIALALFFGWGLIRDRFKGWWKILLSLVIVAGVFMGATKLEMKYAEYVTGATGLDNYAGWSVYVGSSEVNGGSWNEADAKVFWDDYLLNGYTIAEANSEVMKLGIDRYVERGIVGNIGFLGIKAARFALKTPTSIYYFAQSWGWSAWLIYAWGWLFTLVCWAGLIVGLVRGWRGMLKGGFLLLLVLVVLGMFASGLLVEVMDRYFIPVLAVMFLVGACYAQKASQ